MTHSPHVRVQVDVGDAAAPRCCAAGAAGVGQCGACLPSRLSGYSHGLRYQNARLMKSPPGLPMTLGNAAVAHVRLIVWCKVCGHQVEPDPAELAERHGADVTVRGWCKRLACSKCGNREADMVVTGTERRH